ncbi:hypothetical protein J2Z44_000272 [Clostridium punense]|uniref:Uncharacterized protein n=1 Tax=Clostridium punense TaxID=1054297 RepID=A0ABS4JY76_9CLOT|nr:MULTISPECIES: hypothetical protein [Clostridium]EQB89966.1 hypothetical protein M918_02490 [Clostridium sp. BL8]MBP2020488.1 hypothetical protein [Clostridium punense]
MEEKQIILNPSCPCTRKCKRHGNCKECKENHKDKKLPTWCKREEKLK